MSKIISKNYRKTKPQAVTVKVKKPSPKTIKDYRNLGLFRYYDLIDTEQRELLNSLRENRTNNSLNYSINNNTNLMRVVFLFNNDFIKLNKKTNFEQLPLLQNCLGSCEKNFLSNNGIKFDKIEYKPNNRKLIKSAILSKV